MENSAVMKCIKSHFWTFKYFLSLSAMYCFEVYLVNLIGIDVYALPRQFDEYAQSCVIPLLVDPLRCLSLRESSLSNSDHICCVLIPSVEMELSPYVIFEAIR